MRRRLGRGQLNLAGGGRRLIDLRKLLSTRCLRAPRSQHPDFRIAIWRIFPHPILNYCCALNLTTTVARKGGAQACLPQCRLSRRVDLLTRLTLHAIRRMSARARVRFCAILLRHISYPPDL
jgi:hypothetical protein